MTESKIPILPDVRERAFRIDLSMGEGCHETAEQPLDPDHDAANLAEMLSDAIRHAEADHAGIADATLELDNGEDEDDTIIRIERGHRGARYHLIDAAGATTTTESTGALIDAATEAIQAWQDAHGLREANDA